MRGSTLLDRFGRVGHDSEEIGVGIMVRGEERIIIQKRR